MMLNIHSFAVALFVLSFCTPILARSHPKLFPLNPYLPHGFRDFRVRLHNRPDNATSTKTSMPVRTWKPTLTGSAMMHPKPSGMGTASGFGTASGTGTIHYHGWNASTLGHSLGYNRTTKCDQTRTIHASSTSTGTTSTDIRNGVVVVEEIVVEHVTVENNSTSGPPGQQPADQVDPVLGAMNNGTSSEGSPADEVPGGLTMSCSAQAAATVTVHDTVTVTVTETPLPS